MGERNSTHRENNKGELINGERDCISVCRIMTDNGQILKRSPWYIGEDWLHI
jgi:hypothetical protein